MISPRKERSGRGIFLAEPAQGPRHEYVLVDAPGDRQRYHEYEADRHTETERRLHVFGYRQERAHSQKVGEYHVVDEYPTDEQI